MLRDEPYERQSWRDRDERDDYDDDYRDPERKPMWRTILIGIAALMGVGFLSVVALIVAANIGLPSLADLQTYEPPVTSRVHAGDGALVAEFAREQRVYVPIEQIPDHVKNAFVAVEDARFFEHSGFDYAGIARAMFSNVGRVLTGQRPQGASTITQQVAGNMLTGRAAECEGGLSGLFCAVYTKVREGLVAQRIERVLDKDRILELYLNEIYLGNRAYGVAAASLNYFNKPLSELTVSEAAYLAILPKGPGNYQLPRHRDRALDRRNYAIGRMLERGYITAEQAEEARAADLEVTNRLAGDQFVAASHFVEEIRRQIQAQYGEDALYNGGLSIRSTIDTRLQLAAARSLRAGLEAYDRRHDWRGPIGRGDPSGDVAAQLGEAQRPPSLSGWIRAMVTGTSNGAITVRDENGATGRLTNDDAQWAAQGARRNRDRALSRGAIVYVTRGQSGRYTLKQIPQVQGALVAMDPHTGRVLAMVGGYSFKDANGLNRATQASRQPGSSFKPIVYAAALDYGLTPSTLVDDGPLAIEAGDGTNWSPENYTEQYYGPTTLRRGLELSRNAMTARVAYEMGAERILQYGQRLGVYGDDTQAVFALALGAGETTLMRMTTAYGMFVNGGRRIQPIIIDRIQDRTGAHRVPPRPTRMRGMLGGLAPARPAASAGRPRASDRSGHCLSDRVDGRRRRAARHRDGRRRARLSARRQDRHYQRLQGRLVHRLLAGPRRRRVGGLRYARRHGRRRNGRAHRRADLPRLHARSAARHAGDAVPHSGRRAARARRLHDAACCRRRSPRRPSSKRIGPTPSRRAMWRPRPSCSAAPIRSTRACCQGSPRRSKPMGSPSNVRSSKSSSQRIWADFTEQDSVLRDRD